MLRWSNAEKTWAFGIVTWDMLAGLFMLLAVQCPGFQTLQGWIRVEQQAEPAEGWALKISPKTLRQPFWCHGWSSTFWSCCCRRVLRWCKLGHQERLPPAAKHPPNLGPLWNQANLQVLSPTASTVDEQAGSMIVGGTDGFNGSSVGAS